MSELPRQADPDLHAIFGIDGEPDGGAERVISVERAARGDGEIGGDGGLEMRLDVDPGAISGAGLELEAATRRRRPVRHARQRRRLRRGAA